MGAGEVERGPGRKGPCISTALHKGFVNYFGCYHSQVVDITDRFKGTIWSKLYFRSIALRRMDFIESKLKTERMVAEI